MLNNVTNLFSKNSTHCNVYGRRKKKSCVSVPHLHTIYCTVQQQIETKQENEMAMVGCECTIYGIVGIVFFFRSSFLLINFLKKKWTSFSLCPPQNAMASQSKKKFITIFHFHISSFFLSFPKLLWISKCMMFLMVPFVYHMLSMSICTTHTNVFRMSHFQWQAIKLNHSHGDPNEMDMFVCGVWVYSEIYFAFAIRR